MCDLKPWGWDVYVHVDNKDWDVDNQQKFYNSSMDADVIFNANKR